MITDGMMAEKIDRMMMVRGRRCGMSEIAPPKILPTVFDIPPIEIRKAASAELTLRLYKQIFIVIFYNVMSIILHTCIVRIK